MGNAVQSLEKKYVQWVASNNIFEIRNCEKNKLMDAVRSLIGEHGARADDSEPAAAPALLPVRVECADRPVEREGDAAARQDGHGRPGDVQRGAVGVDEGERLRVVDVGVGVHAAPRLGAAPASRLADGGDRSVARVLCSEVTAGIVHTESTKTLILVEH